MSRHGDDRMLGAYVSPEVAGAVESIASSEGVTKSDVMRDGLVTRLLAFARPDEADDGDE